MRPSNSCSDEALIRTSQLNVVPIDSSTQLPFKWSGPPRYLLENGVDPDPVSQSGRTPLLIACEFCTGMTTR